MEQIFIDYLNKFEDKLRKNLINICVSNGALAPLPAGMTSLIESDDITGFWKRIEPNYMADAVPNIASYPTVSVAWATYLGMAVAYCWDVDWTSYSNADYESFYGSDGFDNMDDHIVSDILQMPLNSADAKRLVTLVQSLAQETVDMIRREQIEPQSKMAFHAFARACNAMFSIGAAMELHQLGYKYEKQ